MMYEHKRQRNKYYCGPAVVQIVLAHSGIHRTQRSLAYEAHTTKERGTMPRSILVVLKRYSLNIKAGNNQRLTSLRSALRKKQSVIVCYLDESGEGHYSLVLSISSRLKLLDPNHKEKIVTLKLSDFLKRWQDPVLTRTHRWAAYVS